MTTLLVPWPLMSTPIGVITVAPCGPANVSEMRHTKYKRTNLSANLINMLTTSQLNEAYRIRTDSISHEKRDAKAECKHYNQYGKR